MTGQKERLIKKALIQIKELGEALEAEDRQRSKARIVFSNDVSYKGMVKTIDHKLQNFKVASGRERIISGYVSTNDIDRTNDVTLPTAFEKTMQQYMKNPIVCYMHDWKKPIGKMVEYRIDNKGLWAKIQIAKGITYIDNEIWPAIEQGVIKCFSYGYRTIDQDRAVVNGKTVNKLKEVELLETSVVTVPMNAAASFTVDQKGAIKSIGLLLRGKA